MTPMLEQVIYTSTATRPQTEDDLAALLDKAREYNEQLGLSGLLIYDDGAFFQILEGEDDALEQLYERIEQDPRHHDMFLLLRRPIAERNFAGWSMGFCCAVDLPEPLPGHAELRAARAAGLRTATDTALVERLTNVFMDGGWHHHIS
jgi:hypothetical protein